MRRMVFFASSNWIPFTVVVIVLLSAFLVDYADAAAMLQQVELGSTVNVEFGPNAKEVLIGSGDFDSRKPIVKDGQLTDFGVRLINLHLQKKKFDDRATFSDGTLTISNLQKSDLIDYFFRIDDKPNVCTVLIDLFVAIFPLINFILMLNTIFDCTRKRQQPQQIQQLNPTPFRGHHKKKKLVVEPSIRISLQGPVDGHDSIASARLDMAPFESAADILPASRSGRDAAKTLIKNATKQSERAKSNVLEPSEKDVQKIDAQLPQQSSVTPV
ncbi:unnamed protein product [Anisakis simplex]|uniref:Transmembrane protein n=1 Tax=Anisakis simplex TaxID=6269 RepID=A0A0M3JVU8_ANISI|nr:unnamed protein product [Anisakis simplex]